MTRKPIFGDLPWPPWPAPLFPDFRRTRMGFAAGRWYTWTPPEDARADEHPGDVMARHLAEAYWPEGVPESRSGRPPSPRYTITLAKSPYE